MRVFCTLLAIVFAISVRGQEAPKVTANPQASPNSSSCGGGHTVDEYLGEKNRIRKQRNKNPLPTDTCIWGWCRETTPPSDRLPTSHPPQQTPTPTATPTARASTETGESSSKPKETAVCDPYSAAQDVEVGDFYYQDKNYRAALSRYEGALQSKPGDPGIFFRLGKTAEKLGDLERAKREYQSSIDTAAEEGPSGMEAKAALERIKSKNDK
jgi:tetratricopeptide (TPR) repeat protein